MFSVEQLSSEKSQEKSFDLLEVAYDEQVCNFSWVISFVSEVCEFFGHSYSHEATSRKFIHA